MLEDLYMAISEDLRSVQAMLDTMDAGNATLMRLLCDNLSALADQVEALEAVPLAPPSFLFSRSSTPPFTQGPVCRTDAPLQ